MSSTYIRVGLSGTSVRYEIPEMVTVNQNKSTRYRDFSTINTLIEELQFLGPLVAATSYMLPPRQEEQSFWTRYFGSSKVESPKPIQVIVVGAVNGKDGDYVYFVICSRDPGREDSSTQTYRPINQKVHEVSHKAFFNNCEELYPPKVKK